MPGQRDTSPGRRRIWSWVADRGTVSKGFDQLASPYIGAAQARICFGIAEVLSHCRGEADLRRQRGEQAHSTAPTGLPAAIGTGVPFSVHGSKKRLEGPRN